MKSRVKINYWEVMGFTIMRRPTLPVVQQQQAGASGIVWMAGWVVIELMAPSIAIIRIRGKK